MKKHYLLIMGTLFACLSAQAQTPTVTTQKRFVRGATMAFGRMSVKNNGATIKEQGFCYAEQSEPTIDDARTTGSSALYNGNAPIYWLQNLKPATKYYMRAYATTTAGQTAYGDVIKFYTIPKGQITFTMRTSGDADSERIRAAAQTAIDWWNALTEMKGYSPNIGYEPGTPTADCSYGGWIRVGSNQSYQRTGTIMHEMLHGCGVIPWADTEWSRVGRLRSGVTGDGYGTGQWLGDRVTEALRFWDNSETATLTGDYQHMWPYGINGASEDTGSDVLYIGNSIICQALGEDGLQHTSSLFAEPYYALEQEDDVKFYIRNEDEAHGRYTSYLVPTQAGTLRWREMTAEEALSNDSAAWLTTFTPHNQYYQIRNAATGRYISSSGSTFSTVSRTTTTASEDLHLMRGRTDVDGQRGYWVIHPTSNWTPNCLQASAGGITTSATFNIANSAQSQRWLIQTAEQLKTSLGAALASAKNELATMFTKANALSATPHSELADGTDQAYKDLLETLRQQTDEATSKDQLQAIEAQLRQGIMQFLKNVVPTSSSLPFELTALFVANPGFDTDASGWSQTASVSYSCAEFYQTTFDINQTVAGLPGGKYRVTAQGFQRPGSSQDAAQNYGTANEGLTAYLYAGSEEVLLANIMTGARANGLGGAESTVQVNGRDRLIPNNMQAASLYFKSRLYNNTVECSLDADDSDLKFGLRSASMPANYWVIFDNFRLFYLGRPVDAAISDTPRAGNAEGDHHVYTLDGRRLASGSALRPGLYVRDGKKVVVR